MNKDRIRLGFLASAVSALWLCAPGVQAAEAGGKIPITTASKEAREHYQQGYTLAQNFQVKAAAEHYAQAVALDPGFALGYLGLATTLPTAKDFFENLGKAVALADKVSEGERLWIQGVQAGANGAPQKQMDLYKELVALHPQDEQSHLLLGLASFGRSDFDAAIAELKAVAKLNPQFPQAYNMLGYSYRSLEKYPEAEKAFKRYAEVLPDNPNPYDSYAELLLKIGRFDESIAQYRKALAVDPHFVASELGIASSLAYQGKHDEARAQLQKAYATARDDGERRGILAQVAATEIDAGQYDKALEAVQKMYALAEAIQDASNMSGDLGLMATILYENGQFDAAAAKLEASVQVMQSSQLAEDVKQNAKTGSLFNATRLALATHDVAAAKVKAQDYAAQAAARNNVFQLRAAHLLAGLIALEEKDPQTAIAELLQANQQDPYVLFWLAKAHEAKGDAEQARVNYEKVAKYNLLNTPNYAFVRSKALQKVGGGT